MYTNGSYDDVIQAYSAGLAEGHITHDLLEMSLYNMEGSLCKEPSTFCVNLKGYLEVNLKWMASQIEIHAGSDPYWHHVSSYLGLFNIYTVFSLVWPC